jgi:hypothetical protein
MLRTKVEVNGKQLNFAVMGDTRVAHVKLVFLQQDGDKQFVDRDRRSLTFRLTRPQFEAAARQGLRFTTSVPLQSMTSQFRVVMQDLSTGNIGALTFAVAGLPHSD